MEARKLTVEIRVSEEELKAFDEFIESGPYDKEKLVKRLIFREVEQRNKNILRFAAEREAATAKVKRA
jgi:hypothetical protein